MIDLSTSTDPDLGVAAAVLGELLPDGAAVAALAQGLGATVSREGDGNVLDAV